MAPDTHTLIELDKRHVWHPFTQMSAWTNSTPLMIARGEGNYLFDTDGNQYLDGVSSLWTNLHGHNHPTINQAIRDQLDQLDHSTLLGAANVPSTLLAHALASRAPAGLTRVFYSDSGSTAVEIALKQAFQYWRQRGRPDKQRFVHLDRAYHGDTLGAVGVGGIEIFHDIFGDLTVPGFCVASPALVGLEDAIGDLERVLASTGNQIAAVIVEPLVQGAGGILVHPPGYLRATAELCRQHEVLLIADEVATGFGRTGSLFACEQEQVIPDFLCLAKGITGGYLPLAATLTNDEIYSAFLGPRSSNLAFFHGHTYTGNPIAAAAALGSLQVFEDERTLETLPDKITWLQVRLADLDDHPAVKAIRQRGLMVGVDVGSFPTDSFAGATVCELARNYGVLLRPLGDTVVLMPPLSITSSQIDDLVGALRLALNQLDTSRLDGCQLAK